jgi:hypothetical protein
LREVLGQRLMHDAGDGGGHDLAVRLPATVPLLAESCKGGGLVVDPGDTVCHEFEEEPTLGSSTVSSNYAEASKPNKPAHIAPAPWLRVPRHHNQTCSGGASGLPAGCLPRQLFLRVPSS